MTTRTKAAPVPQIALGAHVTVPPLPGLAGLPGVWVVDSDMLCGATRFLLLLNGKGADGWTVIDAARCVLAAERKASA